MIKTLLTTLVLALCTSNALATSDFKGEPPTREFTSGGMAGVGQVYSEFGFAVIGSVAKKILNKGFVPDINNQVFVELQGGPLFINKSTLAVYSAHLRWDFVKDINWTLYGIGGLGGSVGKLVEGGKSEFVLNPRFAAGAFVSITSFIALRLEASSQWTTLGVSFGI